MTSTAELDTTNYKWIYEKLKEWVLARIRNSEADCYGRVAMQMTRLELEEKEKE